jgi:nucleoside-diphosphate-sugar epimerase
MYYGFVKQFNCDSTSKGKFCKWLIGTKLYSTYIFGVILNQNIAISAVYTYIRVYLCGVLIMSILLTGATGFIGREVVKTHKNKIKRVLRRYDEDCQDDVFIIGELSNLTNWSGAFDSVDSVIHLAGLAHLSNVSASDYIEVNTNATLHLAMEAAKANVKRFVFISSIGVHGDRTKFDSKFSFSDSLKCHNLYSQSKLEAEIGLKKISDLTGMELVIVRPTLVYGNNAPGNFGRLTKLVKTLPFLPFGLVSNKRDFISVYNLADLLVTCAEHPAATNHVFLASDMESVSIKQFTNAMAVGLGKKVIQLPIPVSIMKVVGKLIGKLFMVEQLVENLQVDSSNIKEVLNWMPPYTMEESMVFLKDNK